MAEQVLDHGAHPVGGNISAEGIEATEGQGHGGPHAGRRVVERLDQGRDDPRRLAVFAEGRGGGDPRGGVGVLEREQQLIDGPAILGGPEQLGGPDADGRAGVVQQADAQLDGPDGGIGPVMGGVRVGWLAAQEVDQIAETVPAGAAGRSGPEVGFEQAGTESDEGGKRVVPDARLGVLQEEEKRIDGVGRIEMAGGSSGSGADGRIVVLERLEEGFLGGRQPLAGKAFGDDAKGVGVGPVQRGPQFLQLGGHRYLRWYDTEGDGPPEAG
jgi:hypothetical protein